MTEGWDGLPPASSEGANVVWDGTPLQPYKHVAFTTPYTGKITRFAKVKHIGGGVYEIDD